MRRACLGDDADTVVRMSDALKCYPDSCIEEVREATSQDINLQKLLCLLQEGWPNYKGEVPGALQIYFDFRDTLIYEDSVNLKGCRILIPNALRAATKKKLHLAHLGYDIMMRHARDTVFWSGMAKEIKNITENCVVCQRHKPINQKETLIQDDSSKPWENVGIDLFEIEGRHYLVAMDYYISYIEVEYLKTTTSTYVIEIIKKICARNGAPVCLIFDGGPQFNSLQFRKFAKEWAINHVMSSPGHPQDNEKAEAAVKVIKIMMKTYEEGGDQYLALLELRNTPRQDSDLSPAQMMFGER